MLISEAITDLQNLTQSKISYGDVAEVLGVSKQAIGNRVARNSELQEFEWLKLKEHFEKIYQGNYSVANHLLYSKDVQHEERYIDYYPEVFGSCGNGTFVLAESKEKLPISKRLFGLSPSKTYSVINAMGDSMYPVIYDKDKLIVEHWEGEQIKDNNIYVFRYGDKIYCKRLVDNVTHVLIKSENPIYEPIAISYKEADNDLQIIGRIIGIIRDFD